MYLVVPVLCEDAPPRRAFARYGTTGAPGAGFGMRKVYTTPNTMVRPFVVANALYSFSHLKNTFQLFFRSI